ncbi:MAG: hypothetical protein KDD04_04525 [Sinomicrobium sp.]|nr:hypothetical protein [Sinomicrobium sp.]
MDFISQKEYKQQYESDLRYGAKPDDFDNVYSLRNPYGLHFETERINAIMGLLNEHQVVLPSKKIPDVGCHYGFYANLFAYL